MWSASWTYLLATPAFRAQPPSPPPPQLPSPSSSSHLEDSEITFPISAEAGRLLCPPSSVESGDIWLEIDLNLERIKIFLFCQLQMFQREDWIEVSGPQSEKSRCGGGWTPWASRDGSVMFMYQRTLSPGAVCFMLKRNLPRVGSVGVAVVTRELCLPLSSMAGHIENGQA